MGDVPIGQPIGSYEKRPDPLKELVFVIKAALWSTSFLSYLALLVLSIAFLFALTPDIQNWIASPLPDGVMHQDVLFVLVPFPLGLIWLEGAAFQIWHIIILAVFAILFFYGMHDMLASWLGKKKGAEESLVEPEKAGSGIEGVAKLFFAVTFFSFMYFLLLEGSGVSPETPAFDELSTNELLYRLFSASVWEEIVSRTVLIGVPLMIFAVIFKWGRPYSKFLVGGGMKLNILTLWLIMTSALIFAFAHVGSWDLWKVPQVLVSGMALGYAFVRFGLFASVMLHFSINFITTWVYEFWPENMGIQYALGMLILIWIVAGSYFFMEYSIRFGKKVLRIGSTYSSKARDEDNHGMGSDRSMPASTRNERGFVCPHCGDISARYENGTLICLTCGKPATPVKDEEKDDKIDLENMY